MEREEHRFFVKYFSMKGGRKRFHEKLIITLAEDAYELYHVKIWIQKFRNNDLACKLSLYPRQLPLTFGPQLETFRQKYPVGSARVIDHCFPTTVPTIKDLLD
jgi:hypothetical protein